MTHGSPTDLPRLRVLIVDDTPDIRMLLRAALTTIGKFDIVGEAADGAQGVEAAASLLPDVVLLDLAMPVMDGLQAAPEIKRRSPTSKVVILSGFSKDRMEQEALEAGVDAYVEKGTKPQDLVEIVRKVCSDEGPPPSPGEATGITPVGDEADDPPGRDDPGGLEAWRRKIAMAVEQVVGLSAAFASFGRAVGSRVPFARAGFAVAGANGYRVAATCGPSDWGIPVGTIVPIQGAFATALDDGRSFCIDDTAESAQDPVDRYFYSRGIRSYAAVPLRSEGRARAVVGFSSEEPGVFASPDMRLLEVAVKEAAAPLYMLWCMGRKSDFARELAQADGLRQEWERMVRHDLRSPLTVISGYAETMRTAWTELPDQSKFDFVDAIARGAQAMTTMLADLDRIDQVESGLEAREVHKIDLGSLVQQTVLDVMTSTGRTVITQIPDELPPVMANETDQMRVVSNLLENAFKFSGDSHPIEVSIHPSGAMLHVVVKDFGIGIAEEDHAKIFEKFSRIPQGVDRNTPPGSGLGLYICRSIVEANGGRIWIESEPECGSTFHYTVPAASA